MSRRACRWQLHWQDPITAGRSMARRVAPHRTLVPVPLTMTPPVRVPEVAAACPRAALPALHRRAARTIKMPPFVHSQ
eukprot:233210-Chlamydomonas_euryale.AAC.4